MTASKDLSRRVAVTLTVLAFYQAGSWIALPGIETSALRSLPDGSLAHSTATLSLFALGVTPLLSVWLILELAMILIPFLREGFAAPAPQSRLNRRVAIASMPLAAFQAWGIAVATEMIDGLVPEPGLGFRLTIVVTLVTATLLTAWFASIIERDGVGSGFWVMFSAPIPLALARSALLAAEPQSDAIALLAPAALFALAAIGATTLLAHRDPRIATNGQLIWPALLAGPVSGLALIPLWAIGADLSQLPPLTLPLMAAALGAGFVLLRNRSLPESIRSPQRETYRLAALLAALIAGGVILKHWSGTPVPADGATVMTLTGIALALSHTLRPAPRPA